MSEGLTLEQSAELKKSLKLPEVSRILAAQELEPAAFERYVDARTALSDPGITGYPPDIALKPDFPIVLGPEPKETRTLDDSGLEADLDAALKNLNIAGYMVRARRRGQTVFSLSKGWARLVGNSDPTSWSSTVKMHVASVSKLVTSMAVTKLLFEKGINSDTPVVKFLPSYFVVGPNSEKITFRHLLTHTSGFHQMVPDHPEIDGPNDGYTFGGFKFYFHKGVKLENIGKWSYHNGNYISLRIALAILTGKIDRNAGFDVPGLPDSNDTMWDLSSIGIYVKYVERTVFAPASVTASLDSGDKDSLPYSSTLMAPGWRSKSSSGAGTEPWWLSVDEILSIMAAYWQSDAIVPQSVRAAGTPHGFGLDEMQSWQFSGKTQDCFTKSGYWADKPGHTQQCVVAFAPNDTEVAAFVNSPIAGNTIRGI